MPRFMRDRLSALTADRRYWDKKHPEHQAHLDFTVKAFEQTYPDPLVPTKEQEEWAARENLRLRELSAKPAYWNNRHPDHARALAEVTRGYDKLNAVLYGTQAPARAETPKPAPRDPLDPVMSAPTSFARAMSDTQTAQAGQAGPVPTAKPYSASKLQTFGLAPRAGYPPSSELPEVQTTSKRDAPTALAESVPRPNPPKVIHPDISAPPGIDGNFIWSPLMVTPSQIEMLWRDLEDPHSAFESFKKGHEQEGTRVPDPTTGELRPPTEKELENWFKEWQEHVKDFLQDYYEKKDPLFPDEGERVPPLMPIQPENPVG